MDLNHKIYEAYLLGQEEMRQRASDVPTKIGNHDPKIDAFLKDIGFTVSKHIKDLPLKKLGD